MSTQKNKLDEFFKNSFEKAELNPEDASWLNLGTKMLNKQAENDRKKIFFLRWFLVATVLLFVSCGSIYFFTRPQKRILSETKDNAAVINGIKQIGKPYEKDRLKEQDNKNENNLQKQNFENSIEQNNNSIHSVIEKEKSVMVENIITYKLSSEKIKNKQVISEKKVLMDELKMIKNNKSKNTNEKQLIAKQTDNRQSIINNETVQNNNKMKTTEVNNVTQNIGNEPEVSITDSSKNNKNENLILANTSLKIDSSKQNLLLDTLQSNEIVMQSDVTALSESTKEMKDDTKQKNWYVEVMYSSDYAYQNYANATTNNGFININETYEQYIKPKYGYSYGFNIGYSYKEKWSLQVGINYANKGEKTTASISVDTFSNTSNTFTPPLSPFISTDLSISGNRQGFSLYEVYSKTPQYSNIKLDSIYENQNINHKYEYFDLPFLVGYHFRKNKFSIHPSFGASLSFFYRYRIVQLQEKYKDRVVIAGDDTPFKKVYYSALINIGAEYRFSNKFSFNIEPTFRYGLTSIVKNLPVNGYLHSFGLVTGLRYHF